MSDGGESSTEKHQESIQQSIFIPAKGNNPPPKKTYIFCPYTSLFKAME